MVCGTGQCLVCGKECFFGSDVWMSTEKSPGLERCVGYAVMEVVLTGKAVFGF